MGKFMGKILSLFLICFLMLAVSNKYYGYSTVSTGSVHSNGTQKATSPIDFGAKGDGVTDDSQAFVAMLRYLEKNKIKRAELKGGYVYNLGNKTIQLPHRILLEFDDCILKNGKLA